MAKKHGNYMAEFKSQMVAESRADGATAPILAKRHNVPVDRIYAWRSDKRYQGDIVTAAPGDFVEIAVAPDLAAPEPSAQAGRQTDHIHRIEITLENGRRISISDGVDAGFVLELARGLAA